MRTAPGDNRLSAKRRRLTVPNDDAVAAWVHLAYSYHHMIRRLESELIEHDLTLAQFEVLAHLHYEPGIVQTDLARRLLVSKGNVCGLIDRLAAARLVRRRVCQDDRRANRLLLTQRGTALIAAAMPDHLSVIRSLLGRLPQADLRRLRCLLEHLEAITAGDGARPHGAAETQP